MACCNATTATLPAIGAPDPHSHVAFTKGMVLGVADYVQEHAYLVGRSEWMARDLIGYGTASGLAVSLEGSRVHVSAGSAVVPSGKMICVGREQCGPIQGWLDDATNGKAVGRAVSGSPPATAIRLYLTLCWRDCAIAPIPVPGEPCRSDEELMQPSRIADDYCLEFRLDPPEQWETDAIGTFSVWLDAIADTGPASPPLAPGDWEAEIKAALDAITGDFLDGSPPVGARPPVPPLAPGVSSDDYDAFLRLAYRLWITEYRPKVMAQRCGDPAARANDCVLLAALDVPLAHGGGDPDTGWSVAGDVTKDESRRPLIAPLHLVQTALGIMMDSGSAPLPSQLPPAPPPATEAGALRLITKVAGEADLSIDLDDMIDCLVTTGDKTVVNLPPVSTAKNGRTYWIKALAVTGVVAADDDIVESLDGFPAEDSDTVRVPPGDESVSEKDEPSDGAPDLRVKPTGADGVKTPASRSLTVDPAIPTRRSDVLMAAFEREALTVPGARRDALLNVVGLRKGLGTKRARPGLTLEARQSVQLVCDEANRRWLILGNFTPNMAS